MFVETKKSICVFRKNSFLNESGFMSVCPADSMVVQKVKGLLYRLLKVPAADLKLTYTSPKVCAQLSLRLEVLPESLQSGVQFHSRQISDLFHSLLLTAEVTADANTNVSCCFTLKAFLLPSGGMLKDVVYF